MARILVVDDDPAIRAGLVRLLVRFGHDAVEAGDGKEALQVMEEATPDLVITDINMPEMDGIEVINALLKERPGLPVVAISGGGRLDKGLLLGNALALGAVSSLSKPFEVEQVLAVIDEALRQPRPEG